VLLTAGVALAGIAASFALPVSPLPQVDYPTISVSARLPGASPETMATSVATPLERRLGLHRRRHRDDVEQRRGSARVSCSSSSIARSTRPRARCRRRSTPRASTCPATLRSNPTYRKANPAGRAGDDPGADLGHARPGQIYDAVSNVVQQKLAQADGVGDVELGGGSLPAVRVELLPFALNRYGMQHGGRARGAAVQRANRPKGDRGNGRRLQIYSASAAGSGRKRADYRAWSWPGATARRSGWPTSPRSSTASRTRARWACSTASRRWSC
jgi:multidrug efflux pump